MTKLPDFSRRSLLAAGGAGLAATALGGHALAQPSAKPTTLLNVSYDPTRELYQDINKAFIAFWKDAEKDSETVSWPQLRHYLLYPGYLAIFVIVVRWFDSEARFWLPSLIAAIAYVFLAPYLWITTHQRRIARFIRCPSCGDWFGQDASGAYQGPNPKYRGIIETGRCGQCGEQVLSVPDNPV